MKRWHVLLLVLVALCSALGAQSVTLNKLGIKSLGSTPINVGDRVEIRYNFQTSDFDTSSGLIEGASVGTSTSYHELVRIQWYSDTSATTNNGYTDIAVQKLNYYITNNGTAYEDTIGFILPTPPNGSKSFKIRSRIYGDDGNMKAIFYSAAVYSTGDISGYSAFLLINTNKAPYATNVAISNPTYAKVGQTLTGTYTYNDDDDDEEGTTTFRWLRSATESGTYTAISGATSSTYTVQSADADSYLKFEVTPVASTGTSPGTAVRSSASSQVTEAASIELATYPQTIQESANNDGSVGSASVNVKLTNATFITGTISGVTCTGLPSGLSVGSITRVSGTEIKIQFSGAATYHEYAASMIDPNDIYVNVPANMLNGVTNSLTTTNGFYIQFANNPARNLARDSVGNNWVKLTWDAPAGLLTSGSEFEYYQIWRNDQSVATVYPSKGTYFYTDSAVTTGTANTYKIQAIFTEDGNPYTSNISLTPLAITAFSFSNPAATGTINHENKTISVVVPFGTNLTSLVATYTATGATVKVNSSTQTSGTTANNFTQPVVYVLNASDQSTCSYTVTVTATLAAPVPIETGLNATTSSFCAKWNTVSGATGYELDVSTASNFSSFVSGFEALAVGNVTSYVINNISAASTYYFRVRATAANPALESASSSTVTVSTAATTSGSGNTEINDSEPTTINMGSFVASTHGTVNPYVIINPENFIPGTDNNISVSMSYGHNPQGLIYYFSFENASIGNGTFVLSYSGLNYDPTQVGYSISGGDVNIVNTAEINTTAKTITLSISGLSKEAKATYELQIITNDETGETLPIVLSSFTVTALVQGQARIDWITQSETGILGFYILRNTIEDLSTSIVVSPLIPGTNTSTTVAYSFTDEEIPGNGTYYYWLQDVDMDGLSSYFGPVTVLINTEDNPQPDDVPVVTALKNSFPNPFNPMLFVPYDLAKDEHVDIKIFNLRGQFIRELVNADKTAGFYRANWDGKDMQGNPVTSGTYIVRMVAGKYTSTQKIVMLK